MKRILVACEYSGVVRDAFAKRGWDAWSCDLLPSETRGQHYRGNVFDILNEVPDWMVKEERTYNGQHFRDLSAPDKERCNEGIISADPVHWDLLIAHPPCTHLAVSGARWFKNKQAEQANALRFVQRLLDARVERIALENPISIISSRIRKPDQIIQPWQFGHGETKATCLWLKNLPKLQPTNIVDGREQRVWKMSPGPDRWKERSRTFQGIADAMAIQWGAMFR